MNKLEFAMLTNEDAPNAEELRSLIERAVFRDEDWRAVWSVDVTEKLIEAYVALVCEQADDDGKPEPRLVEGSEAFAMFRAEALKAYRATFPDTPDDTEDFSTWPDSMPRTLYTSRLLARLAHIVGFRSAVVSSKVLDRV